MPKAAPRKDAEELRRAAARRAVVDEYGDLLPEVAPMKPRVARLAELAKEIRSWFSDADPAATVFAEGDHYQATLAPCGYETRIENMQAAYDAFGHEWFLANCSLTLTALAKGGLNAGAIAALTVKEQTGSRALTVQELEC
jgi:hypothetical protein